MKRVDRGDTIIELILAFVVFSLASMSAIAVMNKGIAMSQHSLEVTLVRQQMDAQAEIVRYIKDTNNPLWDDIVSSDRITDSPAALSPDACATVDEATAGNGFFISTSSSGGSSGGLALYDTDATHYGPAETYAQVDMAHTPDPLSRGVWLQVANAESRVDRGVTAYDIYIHACWDSIGIKGRPATLGTIVRLYDSAD